MNAFYSHYVLNVTIWNMSG